MTPTELALKATTLRHKIPETPGVYMIFCRSNGKAYIGSTQRAYARMSGHKIKLKQDKHTNPHLQSAFNKYGCESFSFLFIERIDGDAQTLINAENRYISQMERELLFNMVLPAIIGGPKKPMSPEQRAFISRINKGNQYAKGTVRSAEAREASASKLRGRKHSDAQKQKAAAARKLVKVDVTGEKNPNAKITWDIARAVRKAFIEAGGIAGQPPKGGLFARLQRQFGIRYDTIQKICHNYQWKEA